MKKHGGLACVLKDLIVDIRAQQDRMTAAEWVKLLALEANLVSLRGQKSTPGR